MNDILQVSAPWLILWGSVSAVIGIIKITAKVLKRKDIDQSFKF